MSRYIAHLENRPLRINLPISPSRLDFKTPTNLPHHDGEWQPCSQCTSTPGEVAKVEERAGRQYDRVRSTDELSYLQLRAKLCAVERKHNKLKLENVSLKRHRERARSRNKVYKEVHAFLATTTIPGLVRFFPLALKEGWGINKLSKKLRDAAAGKYHVRGYTKMDIDLTILCYELGGHAAVYALNHSHLALPSLSTIQPHRRLFPIIPSTFGIKITDVMENVDTIFGKIPSTSPKVGHNLMLDEVSTKKKIDWVPETDEMVGLCMEDVRSLGTVKVGRDTSTVERAVGAVREETVHIAGEATVAAITRLDCTNYSAKPILIAGTCKHGTWKYHVQIILTLVEGWKRATNGQNKHGPLHNLCTDADAARRAAFFVICMCDEIDEKHVLWGFVKELIGMGLNPRIGKDNLTMDIDYKHLFKRLCTLICSIMGMVVFDVSINKSLLTAWLTKIPGHDWARSLVHTLLNPDDGQDVPRALRLLTAVSLISTIQKTTLNPSEERVHRALSLLGITFRFLLQPFITPGMSLSEQVESLVTFVHLLCALYLQNGSSFISGQLYGDLQTTVKAAILIVAKTRLLNPKNKVYICLLGTDTLETLFGRARMLLCHNPNFNILELRYILQSAMILDGVFQEYPSWERKPRRLKLKSTEDLDRLSPDEWRGEIATDSCDLASSWKAGVQAVEAILQKYGVQMDMTFAERFSKPNTDLMRPLGYKTKGKYPAISNEVDRSLADSSVLTPSVQVDSEDALDPDLQKKPEDLLNIDYDTMVANEMAQRVATAGPHSAKAIINENGDEAFKKSIVNTYFDMTHNVHGSHERLKRVRPFKTAGKAWVDALSSQVDQNSSHFFAIGSLFSTLLSPDGKTLALAVVQCMLLKKEGGSDAVKSVALTELALSNSPYRVMGQVLSLRPIAHDGSDWGWDTDFARFTTTKPKKEDHGDVETVAESPARAKDISIVTHSALVYPLAQSDYRAITPDDFSEGSLGPEFHQDTTWAFRSPQLRNFWDRLWGAVFSNPHLHDYIPVFTGVHTSSLPYVYQAHVRDYPSVLWSKSIVDPLLPVRLKSDKKHCYVWRSKVKDTSRQCHMGRHILKMRYQVKDQVILNKVKCDVVNQVSKNYPCGFCGRKITDTTCTVRIKGGSVVSNCPLAYGFKITPAAQYHPKRPCTNVPILCPLSGCDEVHWKYNFKQHFQDRHPSWSVQTTPGFRSSLRVSQAELSSLEIPLEQVVVWPPEEPAVPSMTVSVPRSPQKRTHSELVEPGGAQVHDSEDKENCAPPRKIA
ncbi:hypothetical protein V5O48_010431, partial [Marasmius crinis-equi]